MSEHKRLFLKQELEKLPQYEFVNDDMGCKVVCLFHNDTNPSGNINLDPYEERAPIGWFRCWSCGTSVPWADFAAKAGLRPIDGTRKSSDDYLDPSDSRDRLFAAEQAMYEHELKALEFFDFPMEEWRSVPTRVLTKLGCKYAFLDRTGKFYVWFPVMIEGDLKGYVKGELEKSDDPKALSYINAPGKWSHEFGLLYYDFAIKMMRRKGLKTIVLCEGPRDSIRLLRHGIPAMSVLGALNFGESKRFLLEKADIDNVIIFMDGDDAGKRATKLVYRVIKEHFNTRFIKLWDIEPDKDPFNCSNRVIRLVKKALV